MNKQKKRGCYSKQEQSGVHTLKPGGALLFFIIFYLHKNKAFLDQGCLYQFVVCIRCGQKNNAIIKKKKDFIQQPSHFFIYL